MTSRERLALVALAVLGAFVCFWRLTVPAWGVDEVLYRDSGIAYLNGDFRLNRGHPWVSKWLIGLSVELFGPGKLAVRLPGATAAFATGGILFLLGRRVLGVTAGLVAAALWWLLPQSPGINVARLDRYGHLEGPMFLLMAVALLCAWRWGERGALQWGLAAAAATGLAASAKFPAVIVLPAVAVVALWVPIRLSARALQVAAMAAVCVAAFLLPYLPDGLHGLHAVEEGLLNQTQHADGGHLQIVAGTTYSFPPWWSHLWWQRQYLGILGVGSLWLLSALGMASPLRRLGRLRAFLIGAIVPGAIILVVSPLKLPHYHLVLAPALCVAVAVGLVAAWRRARPVAVAGGAVLLALCLLQLGTVARIEPDSYAAAAATVPPDADVLVFGYTQPARDELPGRTVFDTVPTTPPSVILVDPVIADRFTTSPLRAYIDGVADGYQRGEVDRIVVYRRR